MYLASVKFAYTSSVADSSRASASEVNSPFGGILVYPNGDVLLCAAPHLSPNKPGRISSRIDCSWGLRTPSARRCAMPAKSCLKAFCFAWWAGSAAYACHRATE